MSSEHTQQAFGSSGGKHFVAKKLDAVLPPHQTYVEPYAGGAALYFYKEPAKKEVLNDKDKEIAFAFRFIRDMTDSQYEALKRKDWKVSRKRFDAVKSMSPQNDIDRFYKFYYLKKGSFRHKLGNVNVGHIGRDISLDVLPKAKKRLRGTAVSSGDAIAMINKHDSPNTVFYLDPPYPNTSDIAGYAPRFTKDDLEKLTNRLKSIKGKFLLSIDKGNIQQIPKRFETKRIRVPGRRRSGSLKVRDEWLVANYPIGKRKPKIHRRKLRTKLRGNGKSPFMRYYLGRGTSAPVW